MDRIDMVERNKLRVLENNRENELTDTQYKIVTIAKERYCVYRCISQGLYGTQVYH